MHVGLRFHSLIYLYHIQIIMILNNYISNKNELIYILLFLLINILFVVIWKFIEKYVYIKLIKDKVRTRKHINLT